jgi:hypothetical protein
LSAVGRSVARYTDGRSFSVVNLGWFVENPTFLEEHPPPDRPVPHVVAREGITDQWHRMSGQARPTGGLPGSRAHATASDSVEESVDESFPACAAGWEGSSYAGHCFGLKEYRLRCGVPPAENGGHRLKPAAQCSPLRIKHAAAVLRRRYRPLSRIRSGSSA